jgi:Fe-Mn family superoxide dismutase
MASVFQAVPPATYPLCGFPLPLDAKPFAIPEKPFEFGALSGMTEQKVQELYEVSHAWYVDALNEAAPETTKTLEELFSESTGPSGGPVSCYSGEVNSLNFFWKSVSPNGGGPATGAIREYIIKSFGSVKGFYDDMREAVQFYGAGWVYLVQKGERLEFVPSVSARNPGGKIILAMPVYSDASGSADGIVVALTKNVNWEFANANIDTKVKGVPALGGMSKDAFVKGLKPSQKKQLDALMAR